MGKLLFKVGFASVTLIVLILLGQLVFDVSFNFPQKLTYGVTFSPQYAKYLGLDWKETYIKMLKELNVKALRLPSYWDILEKEQGKFNFEDLDFMLDEAGKSGSKVILVVGIRQPRWPECHLPSWAKRLSLEQKRAKILQFIQKTVERYRDNTAVWAYQVENEPFLRFFGEGCDSPSKDFLKQEVELVRSLSNKTIIITDSGELGFWVSSMQLSDIFGTTLYRDVYNPLMGYITYPVLPYLYNLKSQIIRNIFAPANQRTIIVELQAEPWLGSDNLRKNPLKQAQFLPVKKMEGYVKYAQKTGFDEVYLWGVEWWYYMAQNGYPEYLEFAKGLFR